MYIWFGAYDILVFFEQVVPIVLQFGLMNQYQYASAASDACQTGAGDACMLTDLHDEILFPGGDFIQLTERSVRIGQYLSKQFQLAFLKCFRRPLHPCILLNHMPGPCSNISVRDQMGLLLKTIRS